MSTYLRSSAFICGSTVVDVHHRGHGILPQISADERCWRPRPLRAVLMSTYLRSSAFICGCIQPSEPRAREERRREGVPATPG